HQEYKPPSDAVFLVVVNPWGQDGITHKTSQTGFHNNLGAWLEIASGMRPTALYYQGTHAEVIVEFPISVPLEKLLGDHLLEEIFDIPGLPGASFIYPYNFKNQGHPERKQWVEALFTYQAIPRDFPIRQPYPPPHRPLSKPVTHHSGILAGIPEEHWVRVERARKEWEEAVKREQAEREERMRKERAEREEEMKREKEERARQAEEFLRGVQEEAEQREREERERRETEEAERRRQEFQHYERPAQLNGAPANQPPPAQVKSEPGVKRDPYEEEDEYARNLWPTPTEDNEDVKPNLAELDRAIKDEPNVKQEEGFIKQEEGLVKQEERGTSTADGGVSDEWRALYSGLEMPSAPGQGGEASGSRVKQEGQDACVKEERRDGFFQTERGPFVKEERRPDPELARAFASLPPDLRDGRYSSDSRASSAGVKQEYGAPSRSVKEEPRNWGGSQRGSASRPPQDLGIRRCTKFPDISSRRANAHGMSIVHVSHGARIDTRKDSSTSRGHGAPYLLPSLPGHRAGPTSSVGYYDAQRDPRQRGNPSKRDRSGGREQGNRKRVKADDDF
ncbi:hypothetical protein EV715DRAFT_259489, partial [Schizophyllum commune]